MPFGGHKHSFLLGLQPEVELLHHKVHMFSFGRYCHRFLPNCSYQFTHPLAMYEFQSFYLLTNSSYYQSFKNNCKLLNFQINLHSILFPQKW